MLPVIAVKADSCMEKLMFGRMTGTGDPPGDQLGHGWLGVLVSSIGVNGRVAA